jgi:hypothetical protein
MKTAVGRWLVPVFVIISTLNPGLANAAAAPPGAPVSVRALSGDSRAAVLWTAAAPGGGTVTAYEGAGRRYLTAARTWTAWSMWAVPGTSRSHSFAGTNGSIYEQMVRARNGAGWGPWSPIVSVRLGLPAGMSGVSATPANHAIWLYWPCLSGNGSTVTTFRIYSRSLIGATWSAWHLDITAGSVMAKEWTGLTNGRRYEYFVVAVNRFGAGPGSPIVATSPKA